MSDFPPIDPSRLQDKKDSVPNQELQIESIRNTIEQLFDVCFFTDMNYDSECEKMSLDLLFIWRVTPELFNNILELFIKEKGPTIEMNKKFDSYVEKIRTILYTKDDGSPLSEQYKQRAHEENVRIVGEHMGNAILGLLMSARLIKNKLKELENDVKLTDTEIASRRARLLADLDIEANNAEIVKNAKARRISQDEFETIVRTYHLLDKEPREYAIELVDNLRKSIFSE